MSRWNSKLVAASTICLLLGGGAVAIAPRASNEAVTETQNTTASTETVSHTINLDEQGRALRGYDPVSYFNNDQPQLGSQSHQFEWDGAVWHFESAANRDAFAAHPEQYAPSNGGFCTFGVVLSKKFDGDPSVWTLYKDRLYVFLNEEVKAKFLQDKAGNLTKVKAIWPTIAAKSPDEL